MVYGFVLSGVLAFGYLIIQVHVMGNICIWKSLQLFSQVSFIHDIFSIVNESHCLFLMISFMEAQIIESIYPSI
jgi:hypothetical protein